MLFAQGLRRNHSRLTWPVSSVHIHIAIYIEYSTEYICTIVLLIASLCVNVPNTQPDLDPLQEIICCHEGLPME